MADCASYYIHNIFHALIYHLSIRTNKQKWFGDICGSGLIDGRVTKKNNDITNRLIFYILQSCLQSIKHYSHLAVGSYSCFWKQNSLHSVGSSVPLCGRTARPSHMPCCCPCPRRQCQPGRPLEPAHSPRDPRLTPTSGGRSRGHRRGLRLPLFQWEYWRTQSAHWMLPLRLKQKMKSKMSVRYVNNILCLPNSWGIAVVIMEEINLFDSKNIYSVSK